MARQVFGHVFSGNVDDVTLGKMLTEAHRGQVDYCVPGGMSVSQSSSVVFDGSGKPDERDSSSAQIRTLLEEQRQTIIEEFLEKVGHHELQEAHAEEERRLLREELWRQKLEFREVHQQKSHRDGAITKIPEFYFRYYRKTKAHRGPGHYFGIIMQSSGTAKWSKLYEWFLGFPGCWISSQWKFTRYQSTNVIPTSSDTWRDVEAFFRIAKPQRRAAKHFGTHMVYRETFFANPAASSSAPFPQELNQWNSSTEEPLHMSTAEKSERPEQYRDLRCQSGPSAKDSVIFSGGDSSKNFGADQQRLQISDLHFDKFPTPASFACWMIRFKTEVCTCSQFFTEAMQWMARRMESPKQGHNRRRRTREGPELGCVWAPLHRGWHTQGEGWINILPWYRLVGVAKNLQWDAKEEEPGFPQG